jgi:hypothetical protein
VGKFFRTCGISFGGPVDFQHQRVTSVHSPGWKNFSFSPLYGAAAMALDLI